MGCVPPEPRSFPFRRGLRTLLRALHILTTGVLLGGHVFDQPQELLTPWLWGSIVTGLVLFATDLYASCAVLLEARGVAVFVKIGLMMMRRFRSQMDRQIPMEMYSAAKAS